ncbi:MAG: hypothetical protein V3U90_02685 [Dehalococcoidia bacterium]
MVADLPKAVMERKGELVQLRRDFHRYPELSFQEKRTSSIVADKLREVGLEVETGVARTGVVGLLCGVAIRVRPSLFVPIWMPCPWRRPTMCPISPKTRA